MYAKTPENYVDAILRLLDNPDEEAHLREAGPALIRNRYSYTSIGKRYSEALDELVAGFGTRERSAR